MELRKLSKCKLLFTFSYFMILNSILLSQVKIKEKVIIKPDSINKNASSYNILPGQKSSADLRIELTSSSGIQTYFSFIWGVDRYDRKTYDGNITFTIPNTVGCYELGGGFNNEDIPVNGCFVLKKYFNDYLVDVTNGCGSGFGQTGCITCDNPGWTFLRGIDITGFGNQELTLDYPSSSNDCPVVRSFFLEPVTDHNICEGGDIYWDPKMPVNIRINSNNAEFYDNKIGKLVGNSITDTIGYINNYCSGIMSKIPHNSIPELTTFIVSVNGLSYTKKLTLFPLSRFNVVNSEMCGSDFSHLSLRDYCITYSTPAWGQIKANLKILNVDENIYFYNRRTSKSEGKEIDINPGVIHDYYLRTDFKHTRQDTIPVIVRYELHGDVQYDTTFVLPSPEEIEIDAQPENPCIYAKKTLLINAWMDSESNCWEPLSDSLKVYAKLTRGEKYCSLQDVTSNLKDNPSIRVTLSEWGYMQIYLIADGEAPERIDTVNILLYSNESKIIPKELSIPIIPEALRVTLDPTEISPGDTADVKIEKWNLETGRYESFPASQVFDIGIIGGCDYGMIMNSSGEKNNHFREIFEPVYFVASDSLNLDSVEVSIRVNVPESGGGEATFAADFGKKNEDTDSGNKLYSEANNEEISVVKGIKPLNKKTLVEGKTGAIKSKLEQRLENLPDELRGKILQRMGIKREKEQNLTAGVMSCANMDVGDLTGVGIGEIKNCNIVLISPTKEKDETITAEPKMPEVICKTRLDNYNKGAVMFEWEYIVDYEFVRFNLIKKNNITTKIPLCSRTGKSTFKGSSTAVNNSISEWTVPFIKDEGEYIYKAISHRAKIYPGYGCEKIITTWSEGDDVFTGGSVTIKIKAKDASGNLICSKEFKVNKIEGDNPDVSVVHNTAGSAEIKAILIVEGRTKQFGSSKFPLYGYPNGYGLMQLDDPAATEKQLWNWKANLEAGKNLYYNEKKPRAEQWMEQYPNTYSNEMLLKCAFQLYNFGRYYFWAWDKLKKKWIPDNRVPILSGHTKKYGEEAWDAYKNILDKN